MKKLPTITGLAAVALAAAGFYGGVEVQRHHATSSSAGGSGAAGFRAAAGGGPPSSSSGAAGGGGSTSSSATTGTVKSIKDGTIYLTTSDGATIKVKTTTTSRVTRNARTSASEVHPGDSVVVQGSTASNGTVTASSVSASSSSS